MIKIHAKFGNYFIAEGNKTIAMCTQIGNAKRIRDALQEIEATRSRVGSTTVEHIADNGPRSTIVESSAVVPTADNTTLDAICPNCKSKDINCGGKELFICKRCHWIW